jgi:hypothetical protein
MRLLPLAVLALLLSAAAPASAKEASRVVVCGASGCADRTDRAQGSPAFIDMGPTGGGPAKGAPFYRLRVRIGVPGDPQAGPLLKLLYVPSSGKVRLTEPERGLVTWYVLSPTARAAFGRAVRGIRPLSAARLPLETPRGTDAPARDGGLPAVPPAG